MSGSPLPVGRVRQTLRMALLIPVIVIGALCGLLAWQVGTLSEHNRWVARTHELIAQTWQVEKLLIDHETGLRARLLTGDDKFLAPYTTARMELPQAFDRLSLLAAGDSMAQERIDKLRAAHEDWLRNAENSLAQSRETDIRQVAGWREDMAARKLQMDSMRDTVDQVLAEADRLLAARQRTMHDATRRLFLVGGLAALLLGLAAAISLHRLVRSLNASYAESFRAQSESLRVSEALAGEVTEQLQLAMGSISDARAAQEKAEARTAELERKSGPR
jgi:CHASE3 domain sensor protein